MLKFPFLRKKELGIFIWPIILYVEFPNLRVIVTFHLIINIFNSRREYILRKVRTTLDLFPTTAINKNYVDIKFQEFFTYYLYKLPGTFRGNFFRTIGIMLNGPTKVFK